VNAEFFRARNVVIALAATLTLATPGHQAAAQPPAAPWFADPMRTEPAQFNRRLRLSVPPDLLAPNAAASRSTAGASGDGLVPLELGCATHATAIDPNNTQWALRTLRASGSGTAGTAGNAGSAAPAAPVLNLPTAIQLAVCHNPQVRASWSQIAQQTAQLGQARSAYWPQIDAGIARQRSSVSYPAGTYQNTRTEATAQNITFSWRLWDFGARSARVEAAQAQIQAALSGQDATLQKAIADVLQSYTEAQAAQARLQTQRQLLPLAERNLLATQRRQSQGAASASDILQARTMQARIQLEQSRAEGELHKAQAQLVYQAGLPPGTAFELSPLLPAATLEITGNLSAPPSDKAARNNPAEQPGLLSETTERLLARTLDDWLAYARQYHPAIEAARAQLKAARAGPKAAQADGLPTIDLGVGHYRNGRPTQTLSTVRSTENALNLTLNVPLFAGFANTYKVRAAQATVEQKEIELQAIEQQTLLELVQRHAEAHATLNNLRAGADLYRAAASAAQSAQRQYEYGAIDILQLNQTLTALQQAQDDLVRTQLEWNRARLRLWLDLAQRKRAGAGERVAVSPGR